MLFSFPLSILPSMLSIQASIDMEVWDEDISTDSIIGTTTLDLSRCEWGVEISISVRTLGIQIEVHMITWRVENEAHMKFEE